MALIYSAVLQKITQGSATSATSGGKYWIDLSSVHLTGDRTLYTGSVSAAIALYTHECNLMVTYKDYYPYSGAMTWWHDSGYHVGSTTLFNIGTRGVNYSGTCLGGLVAGVSGQNATYSVQVSTPNIAFQYCLYSKIYVEYWS